MNIFNALKDIGQLQNNLAEVKDKLKDIEVQGSSGGGLVRLTLNGNFSLVSIELDPVVSTDIKMLQDLIVAAHYDAMQKIQERLPETLMPLYQGFMKQ